MTPARQRVLAVLADGPPRPAAELAREAACSEAVVRGLVAAGVLVAVEAPEHPPAPIDWRRAGPSLSPAQAVAAAALRAAVGGGFAVHLLDGVPGSGKTEVYFEAIAEALAAGRQVLVLLPEIALGAQWRSRVPAAASARRRASGTPTSAEPSGGGPGAPSHRARPGVVVGARSALFLPFPRPRPDRRRRGARRLVQAGGRRHLSRPRHGGGARPAGRHPGGAGLGDAVAGDDGQRPRRPLPRAVPARPPRRRTAAAGRGDRSAPRPAAGTRRLHLAAAAPGDGRDAGGRLAGPAVPQPPRLRAAHPVPGLRPPHPLPGLHRLAGRAPADRPAAVPPLRLRHAAAARPARPAASRTGWRRPGRASSGWPRKWPASFRTRG